jgi:hypothetical protein
MADEQTGTSTGESQVSDGTPAEETGATETGEAAKTTDGAAATETVKTGAKGEPNSRRALQRVNRELSQTKAAMSEMKGALEAMQNMASQGQGSTKAAGERLSDLTPDQIHELWAEDPIKYNMLSKQENYDDIRSEIERDLQQQNQTNTAAQTRRAEEAQLQTFIKSTKNKEGVPDFDELYDSEIIQDYMSENPGTDYKLAYYKVTENKRMATKVETELKKRQDAIAGKGKVPMSRGGGAQQPLGAGKDPRVQDSAKHGGRSAVMAARLAEHRASLE